MELPDAIKQVKMKEFKRQGGFGGSVAEFERIIVVDNPETYQGNGQIVDSNEDTYDWKEVK